MSGFGLAFRRDSEVPPPLLQVLNLWPFKLSPRTLMVMPMVSPDNDRIRRHVVRRYAYDPVRRERRHIVVAAYDNAREAADLREALSAELQRRRAAGEEVDPREHVTSSDLQPGHQEMQRNGRIVSRAIEHGATLDAETWARLTGDLPANIAVLRFESEPEV